MVQPGVVNADLSKAVAAARPLLRAGSVEPARLHDRRQRRRELGRSAHAEVRRDHATTCSRSSSCCPTASSLRLGSPTGLARRLRPVGAVVGSEGTLGIVTAATVRLDADARGASRRCSRSSPTWSRACRAVGAIIEAGLVPAALEIVDQRTIARRRGERLRRRAAARRGRRADRRARRRRGGARRARSSACASSCARAGADARRGRARRRGARSASGARARARSARWAGSRPTSTCTTPSCRAAQLPAVIEQVCAIGDRHGLTLANVFHAGDGNLHPNISFDRRDPDELARVLAAGDEILALCVAAGGVITGEHGIGTEKRDFMRARSSATTTSTRCGACARAFDPDGVCNPGKLLADARASAPSRIRRRAATTACRSRERGRSSTRSRRELRVGAAVVAHAPVAIDGVPRRARRCAPRDGEALAPLLRALGARGLAALPLGARTPARPRQPAAARRRVPLDRARSPASTRSSPPRACATRAPARALGALRARVAEAGWELPLDAPGDGARSAARSRRPRSARAASASAVPRDVVLGLEVVLGSGERTRCGGRVVKNVTGYDLAKLYTGSLGALGVIEGAWLRLRPRPARVRVLALPARPADADAIALAASPRRGSPARAPARCSATARDAARCRSSWPATRPTRRARRARLAREHGCADATPARSTPLRRAARRAARRRGSRFRISGAADAARARASAALAPRARRAARASGAAGSCCAAPDRRAGRRARCSTRRARGRARTRRARCRCEARAGRRQARPRRVRPRRRPSWRSRAR